MSCRCECRTATKHMRFTPVLPPDACLLFIWALLFCTVDCLSVLLCLFHSFNLTENPVFLLSDLSDLSSPVSLMCLTTEQYFYSARGFRACGCLELKELQRGRYVKAQNASTAIYFLPSSWPFCSVLSEN